jgi:hypothetical protein
MHKFFQLDDGRDWLSNGHTSIECKSAIKILGILQEIAVCNCNATINNGILILEDGSFYDLKGIIIQATK